jgi:hypothetical protein
MTWTDIVFERLKANSLEVVCHVPDSVLAPLIVRAEADPFFTVVPLTREEEGVGVLTGGQLSATATVTDLAAMGRGAGLQHVAAVSTMTEFEAGLETWLTQPGPWLAVARIDRSPAPGRPPKDPVWIKLRFMETVNK